MQVHTGARTPRPSARRLAKRVAILATAATVVLLAAPAPSTTASPEPTATSTSSAPTPTHLDVRLRLDGPSARSAGSPSATVLSVDEATGSVPRSRSRLITPREVLVVGVDEAGNERWHSIEPDPRIVRSEAVADDGTISGTTVSVASPELDVAVPLDADVTTLRVLERTPGGTTSELTAIGEAPLDDASATTSATVDNRVDIAIVGDGYTSAQLGDFADDVAAVQAGFLDEDPWKEYGSYLRFHRVDIASAQSGADHPERTPAKYVNTAFDATYNCAGIQRLICVDEIKVFDAVGSRLSAGQMDIVLVLVNDPEYGGSGGILGVASIHSSALELVRHELGHSFGGLADEYGGDSGPSCDPTAADDVNVTNKTTRSAIPWKAWVSAATPVPTSGTTNGVPGHYLGGRYCDVGLYRPTYDSKMRSLDRPYEQINTEQLVKRMYGYVSPIDASSPSASAVAPTAGSQTFSVTPMAPASHSLTVSWTVDGVAAGTGTSINRSFASLGIGNHTVTATVTDGTSMVRNDPEKLLVDVRTWRITDAKAPFASWDALVDRYYRDLVGRAPTASEKAFVVASLAAGTSSRGSVADSLRRSTDNTTNVDPTARLYRAFLGRTPDAGGLKFWIGRRRAGTWTLIKMADYFAGSNEFLRKYGALTNRQFVTRIYTDVMGRTADPSGVDYWTRQLDLKRRTRGSVMVGFSESNEYKRRQAENTDVAAAYILLMGRAPTTAESTDWVNRQQAGTPNVDLLLELLASSKYASHIAG